MSAHVVAAASSAVVSAHAETLSGFCLARNITREQDRQAALSQLLCFASMAKGGIDALIEGNLDQFDALVGENACQLRAAQIYDLATRVVNDASLRRQLIAEKEKVQAVIERITMMQDGGAVVNATPLTLAEYAQRCEIDAGLSEEAALVTRCFLLTVAKKMTPKGATYTETIDETFVMKYGLAKSAAKDLLKKTQITLAAKSIAYLQREARLADESEPRLLPDLVSGAFIKEDPNRRQVAPCLFGMSILLRRALEKGQPILLTLKLAKGESGNERVTAVEHLLFEPVGGEYVLSPLKGADLSRPALVIEGNALYPADDPVTMEEVVKKLVDHNLIEVILANAAAHTQYAGCRGEMPPVEQLIARKRELNDATSVHFLEKMMRKVRKLLTLAGDGFCTKNPTTFCIDHILCNRMVKQVKICAPAS